MSNRWKIELGRMSDLEALRVRVSLGVSILAAILIVISVPLRHAVSPMSSIQLTQSTLSLALCVLGAIAIWVRPNALIGRYGVLGATILFPMSAGYFSGGLDAPVMPLIVLTPLIAGFVAGKRAAIAFSVMAAAIVSSLFLLRMYHLLPPTALITDDAVNQARFINIVALLALGFGVSLLYDMTRQSELKARELLDTERISKIRMAKLASLGEMAAGVAHEINNPLAIVVGTVRTLPKFVGESADLRTRIDAIEKATERIAKIVRSLRKFSRSSDRSQYHVKRLTDIVGEALTLTDAKAKRHSTLVSVKSDADGAIFCDEIEIEQVLVNLISNGIDAAKARDERWVSISIMESDFQVVLKIMDSGSGIPPEVQDRLFQPFFTTKGVGEGTGLGLSIVKGILDDHRATIEVVTSEKNTCFQITFPKLKPVSNVA